MVKRKTKPIMFGLEMILALLANRKRQTRRKIREFLTSGQVFKGFSPEGDYAYFGYDDSDEVVSVKCPYHLGQILWVKETWCNTSGTIKGFDPAADLVFYRADYINDPKGIDGERPLCGKRRSWLPSLFMPRSASRISLKIKSIRVERVQDISQHDAEAEGCSCRLGDNRYSYLRPKLPRDKFAELWDELHGEGNWQGNDFVWVLRFEILEIKEQSC